MEKIYSKVSPNILLHVIYYWDDFNDERQNILGDNEFLQCASLFLHEDKTFRPHKHNTFHVEYNDYNPQESWVVLSGAVQCYFYDIDDSLIATPLLFPGDASFSLKGGHTYKILKDNTRVYEFKTGRYFGQKIDKTFINV